eukprot:Skav204726  [mRNA]  locus=scaffold1549:227647:232804:+ [translate_table: standard]
MSRWRRSSCELPTHSTMLLATNPTHSQPARSSDRQHPMFDYADPNVQNYIGAAPLHYVCLRKSNWRGIANLLLENGANIDCQTFAGKSALHFAAEHQLPELVEVLCMFGADTNLLDVGGRDTVKKQILEHLVGASACLQVEPWILGAVPPLRFWVDFKRGEVFQFFMVVQLFMQDGFRVIDAQEQRLEVGGGPLGGVTYP